MFRTWAPLQVYQTFSCLFQQDISKFACTLWFQGLQKQSGVLFFIPMLLLLTLHDKGCTSILFLDLNPNCSVVARHYKLPEVPESMFVTFRLQPLSAQWQHCYYDLWVAPPCNAACSHITHITVDFLVSLTGVSMLGTVSVMMLFVHLLC